MTSLQFSKWALAVSIPVLFVPNAAVAAPGVSLPPQAEVAEAMMSSLLANGHTLARLMTEASGQPAAPFTPLVLTGNYGNTFDSKSFVFASNPLVYQGHTISSFGAGHFDTASSVYQLDQSSGSFGPLSFTASLTDPNFFDPDPTIKIKWPIKAGPLNVGEVDLEATGDFTVTVTPAGQTVDSAWKYSLTWNGNEVAGGKGTDKYDSKTGKWTTGMVVPQGPTGGLAFYPFSIQVAGEPTTADGSAGVYTMTITPVPEAPAFPMLLGGVAVLAWRRLRQPKR